jgi:hypothetical protein
VGIVAGGFELFPLELELLPEVGEVVDFPHPLRRKRKPHTPRGGEL